MNTAVAVAEMVQTAFEQFGGTGDAGPVVLRRRESNRMKIYIAGKITGLEIDEAHGMFADAERHLEISGHTPLNPMRLVDQDEGRAYEDYLLDALRIVLCDSEAVYMLPNWTDSLGARIEHEIALAKHMPVYYAASELPIGCDWAEEVV